jgi:hypothetical protein
MAVEEVAAKIQSKWLTRFTHSGWRWLLSILTALVTTLKPELLRVGGLVVAVVLASRAFYVDFAKGSKRQTALTVSGCVSLSVLALVLYFGTGYLEGLFPHEPEKATLSPQEVSSIKEGLNSQTAAFIKAERYANESLRGLSFQMLIRLSGFQESRRNYVFDFGDLGRNRFSAYVGPGRFFTLVLIDANGEPHSLVVPLGEEGIPQQSAFYLIAECGTGNQHTILRLRVNAREVGLVDLPFEVKIGELWHSGDILGADLQTKNGGYFDAFESLVYNRTATLKEANTNLLALQDRLTQPVFLRFTGKQWARRNKNDNNLTLSEPIWAKP